MNEYGRKIPPWRTTAVKFFKKSIIYHCLPLTTGIWLDIEVKMMRKGSDKVIWDSIRSDFTKCNLKSLGGPVRSCI